VEVPERDGLDAGDAVENWIGFSEDTIPSDVGELVVEWNDGAADQRMSITRIDPPENGVVFNAEIDTTFDTDGLHYQTIRVTLPDGTFVDDRSVPVLVGGRFERVADIEYLGVGVHFVTNHEGASQDFTISVYGQDPDLYVVRGETYLIENATNPAVDFSVKVADVSSDYFLVDAVDYDTFRNGATADRIRFTIPMDAPNVLYYRSDLAPEMGGVLYVLDE
jgi:hypothetical protein